MTALTRSLYERHVLGLETTRLDDLKALLAPPAAPNNTPKRGLLRRLRNLCYTTPSPTRNPSTGAEKRAEGGIVRNKKAVVSAICALVVCGSGTLTGADPIPGNPYNLPGVYISEPSCNPYRAVCAGAALLPNVNPVTAPDDGPGIAASFDFAQVLIGREGQPNDYLTYVSITSKSDEINVVSITVTVEGAPPITRLVFLGPRERKSPRLNDWPELSALSAGITVEVHMSKPGTAGIAMHPASNFWKGAIILEGR